MAEMNIQRDARVMASDGELGRVTHVVVGPETKEVTHIVVDGDGGEQMIPMSQVASVDGDTVILRGGRAQIQAMAFQRGEYHEIDEDDVREETTRTAQRGGAPLQDAKEDEVEVGGRREARSAEPRRAEREGPPRLQLREERLRVQKEQEQAGEVRLGTRVVEHQETVNVPVREERVVIERTPVPGERAVGGPIRETSETIDIPVMKERVTVEKEAVVTEEVGIRKEATDRTERVSDTVRKEELVVEGDQELIENPNAPRAGEPGRQPPRRG